MNYAELSQSIADWLNKDNIDRIAPTLIRMAQRTLEDKLRIRPMEFAQDVLATPVNKTFTTGVGTLTTDTYYYRVSAIDDLGETLASAETSLAITGPLGINVLWNAVPGALGYKIYGRTTGAEELLATVGLVTTWLDSGALTPSGALPTENTTALLSAGTAQIAIPTDYIELKYLQLVDSSGTPYLVRHRKDSKEVLAFSFNSTDSGLPVVIHRVGDYLVFEMNTDVAYTRKWCYYRRLPTLVASALGTPPGNSNWWSTQAEEAFLMACLDKASLYVSGITEGDKAKWKVAAENAREDVRINDSAESTSGAEMRSAPWK